MHKRTWILPVFVPLLCLASCGQNGVRHDIGEYVLETAYHDDYKILQLTDLHLGDKDNLDLHFKFLDLLIKDGNPDMMVVTGDLFTFASKNLARRLFSFLDSYGVPWTVTFGNHDEQCGFSVDWMTGTLNDWGSHCLFKDIQDDDAFGNCNFAINLMEGNTIHDQLIILDSNRYLYGEYFGYDYIHEDQIAWYERLVDCTKTQVGGSYNSLLFYHIPVPEIDEAYDAVEKGQATLDFGQKREACCPPKRNSGFFDKVLELGSTKAMFFGHDHLNDFRVTYKGVTFCYGVKSTDRIYHDEDMLGANLITVKADHSLEYRPYFHTYAEVA